jgi:hypothetical protein
MVLLFQASALEFCESSLTVIIPTLAQMWSMDSRLRRRPALIQLTSMWCQAMPGKVDVVAFTSMLRPLR